jgi:hypothetical protein
VKYDNMTRKMARMGLHELLGDPFVVVPSPSLIDLSDSSDDFLRFEKQFARNMAKKEIPQIKMINPIVT